MNQLPFEVILGDVNGLKVVNDAFGQAEGDKLLCKTAEILRKSCRYGDLIAGWGREALNY